MDKTAKVTACSLKTIFVDDAIYPRELRGSSCAVEYAERMEAGDIFPPIDVFPGKDGRFILLDGRQRLEAARIRGLPSIQATIHTMTYRDAKVFAASANAKHGKRRSDGDKFKAVAILLKDKVWGKRSTNWIRQTAGVTHHFVDRVRRDLGLAKPLVVMSADGAERPTSGELQKTALPDRGDVVTVEVTKRLVRKISRPITRLGLTTKDVHGKLTLRQYAELGKSWVQLFIREGILS